jgi:radical SAM protein with 4Fe4S-binding SPASM domain
MPQRSRIPFTFVARQVLNAVTTDWSASRTFLKYQLAKETFNLRRPLRGRDGRGDELRLVGIRITDMCNLRCHSCGQWGDNGYLLGKSLKELKQREVPVEYYKRLVDQVLDRGWRPVWYIWGGEPMLYPGLIELLHYIHDKGMPISLVTNATHLAERADDILETCQILHVSVDGPNAEIHNAQRPGVAQNYDNFREVRAGLEAIAEGKKKRGSPYPYLLPISCLTRYNLDYVKDLNRFVSQYADAHVFYLTWWIDPESANEHAVDFERRFGEKPQTHYGWIGTWKDFDHGKLFDRFCEMEEEAQRRGSCPPIMMPELREREQVVRYYDDHKEVFGFNQCVSIFMTIEIDSNGDISLCRDYHDYTIGNVMKDKLDDMWNGEKAVKFRRSIASEGPMPVCRRCCGLMGY